MIRVIEAKGDSIDAAIQNALNQLGCDRDEVSVEVVKKPKSGFFGFGKDIREGVIIERRPTVDEAPTYAKILGVEMPDADGTAITEMLK